MFLIARIFNTECLMIRQLLSLFLITALLANQAVVCCGHTHDGVTSDHSSRAHIHLGGRSHCHETGQHHHHGEEQDSRNRQIPDRSDGLATDPITSSDHDDDTIYVCEQESVLVASGKIVVKKSPCFVAIPGSINCGYRLSEARLLGCSQPRLTFAHALYLQTSRLLL